jgi:hypothetical protein
MKTDENGSRQMLFPGGGCGGEGSPPDAGQDVHDLTDFVRCEEPFDSFGAQIGKRGFEEDGGIHVAALGQVGDDKLHEFVLVAGKATPLQKLFSTPSGKIRRVPSFGNMGGFRRVALSSSAV